MGLQKIDIRKSYECRNILFLFINFFVYLNVSFQLKKRDCWLTKLIVTESVSITMCDKTNAWANPVNQNTP